MKKNLFTQFVGTRKNLFLPCLIAATLQVSANTNTTQFLPTQFEGISAVPDNSGLIHVSSENGNILKLSSPNTFTIHIVTDLGGLTGAASCEITGPNGFSQGWSSHMIQHANNSLTFTPETEGAYTLRTTAYKYDGTEDIYEDFNFTVVNNAPEVAITSHVYGETITVPASNNNVTISFGATEPNGNAIDQVELTVQDFTNNGSSTRTFVSTTAPFDITFSGDMASNYTLLKARAFSGGIASETSSTVKVYIEEENQANFTLDFTSHNNAETVYITPYNRIFTVQADASVTGGAIDSVVFNVEAPIRHGAPLRINMVSTEAPYAADVVGITDYNPWGRGTTIYATAYSQGIASNQEALYLTVTMQGGGPGGRPFGFRNGSESDATTSITVFPNPTADVVSIKAPEAISSVELINAAGVVVASKDASIDSSVSFDLSNQPSGIYKVVVSTSDGSTTHTVVKQ